MIGLPEGWYIDLIGDQSLMPRLMEYPGADAIGVLHDGGTDRVVLRIGSEFSGDNEARSAAEARIKTLHGLLKAAGCWAPAFSAGDPFQVCQDGKRICYAVIESKVYAFDSITAEVIRDGVVQPEVPVKPYLARLAELAVSDGDAAKVLRLLAAPDGGAWTGLYRVAEVIEEVERGWPRLEAKGWISETQRKRFQRTSNSLVAAGDGARHGSTKKHQPPPNPMTLEEGRAYLLMLVQAWLAERLANFERENFC